MGKRVEVVSVQRLKPAFTAEDEAPVEPPCQGRPDANLLWSLLIPLDEEDDPHTNLLQLLLIPLDVEDDHEKLLQKTPPLLRQREKE